MYIYIYNNHNNIQVLTGPNIKQLQCIIKKNHLLLFLDGQKYTQKRLYLNN